MLMLLLNMAGIVLQLVTIYVYVLQPLDIMRVNVISRKYVVWGL